MNIHGIAKPSYSSYEILHDLGDRSYEVEGSHGTVKVWVIAGDVSISVLLVNLSLPRHDIATETVTVELAAIGNVAHARKRFIDAEHANAKARWKAMGAPEYTTAEQVAALHEASQLAWHPLELNIKRTRTTIDVTLQPQSVTVVELFWE